MSNTSMVGVFSNNIGGFSAQNMLGERAPSQFDDAAEATIDSLAESIGKHPGVLLHALLSLCATYEASVNVLPERARFALSTALTVELAPLPLVNATPVIVDLFPGQTGRYIPSITILVDGGGLTTDNDDDVVIVDVSGRMQNPERFYVQAGEKLVIPWHGVFISGVHRLTVTAPSAGATVETVRVFFQAMVLPVDHDTIAPGRSRLRAVLGDGFGLGKKGAIEARNGAQGAARMIGGAIQRNPGAMSSKASGLLSDIARRR